LGLYFKVYLQAGAIKNAAVLFVLARYRFEALH
jgi:hypothetical protein